MSTIRSLSDLLAIVLPAAAHLRVEALEFDSTPPALTFTVTSIQPQARCPSCCQIASRVHSRYARTLADLPFGHLPVAIQVQVRKFFCDTVACPRRVFTERLAALMAPWARRTTRLATQQRHLGLAVGGTAGARLSHHLRQPTTRNTLLHLIRTTPLPDPPTPRVLGVDDWSQREAHSYRTILVDVERHQPIELLPDREAATLTQWLADHPGVEIICRDRAGAYAEGATTGAPSAIQVADRFHLLRNLQATLTRVLEHHAAALRSPPAADSDPAPMASTGPVRVVPPTTPSLRDQAQAQQRRARRLARYEQVRQLRQAGWSGRAIAQRVGLNRNTVQKYLSLPAFPERQPRPPRASVLDPFKPYILDRWNTGCHTGTTIWSEVVQHGYRGKRSALYSYLSRLRQAQGLPPKKRSITAEGTVVDSATRPTTPRSLAWTVLRRPENRAAEDEQRIASHLATGVPFLLHDVIACSVIKGSIGDVQIEVMRFLFHSPNGELVLCCRCYAPRDLALTHLSCYGRAVPKSGSNRKRINGQLSKTTACWTYLESESVYLGFDARKMRKSQFSGLTTGR